MGGLRGIESKILNPIVILFGGQVYKVCINNCVHPLIVGLGNSERFGKLLDRDEVTVRKF